MKRAAVVLILAVIIASGIYWGRDRFFAQEQPGEQYVFTPIERRDMVVSVSATGTLSAVVTVEVGSEVSGQLKELLVDYNSPVSNGQVIAQINPESYETLVRQSEAELEMAEARLESEKTQLLRYQADLENVEQNWHAAKAQAKKARISAENARRNLERQQSLLTRKFISKNDFDQAKTAYEEANAQLEQLLAQERAAQSKVRSSQISLKVAQASIREYEAQVKMKVAALDKRKVDLENTIIRSPVDGVVIDRNVNVGQTVAASLTAPVLFTIAQDLHKMQVSTYVDEADIGQIKEGQTVLFTVDAYRNKRFNGNVNQIRKMGKTIQNVVTYEVIISAENRDLSLMPGMTADVEIVLVRKPQVLAVSNAALRFTPPEEETFTVSGTAGGNSPGQSGGFNPAFTGARGAERPDPEARIQRLAERLNLNQAQQDELRNVFSQMRQKIIEQRNSLGQGGPREGMSAMRDKIRKELQVSVSRILTPEQKLLYDELESQAQLSRGTVWQVNDLGKLQPVRVVLGVSDATHTEISRSDLTEGTQVVTRIK